LIRCEAVINELKERDEKTCVIRYEATIRNQRDEACLVYYPAILVGRKKV
jgi:hypothetical protein